ncbi:MAG: calcium-translocating P-type ATPase, PMCA-type [Rikenellaceae bacterium]|nr:calcium-translocating P-type ATPase, PMCA-type [Rikenellaceae bacterium]
MSQTPEESHTSFSGLSPEEVAESRLKHGENRITPPKEQSLLRLFLEKFRDPIVRILLVAALLSLGIASIEGEYTETIGILMAIFLATGIAFLFEWDAMRRFKRLNRVNDDEPVKVIRGGKACSIPRHEVVVGDLVLVESGEMIPADGLLVEAVSLSVNESMLTGEALCRKSAREADFDPEATYPTNRLLRGTTVSEGYGRMVVEAVGDHTEAGRVTEQSLIRSGEPTPLNNQLERLSKWIGRIGFATAALIFLCLTSKALIWGDLLSRSGLEIFSELLEIFMVAVAVIVMAVPEGLPMAITLSLALSMRRMLKTNNLVRKMHACETMGAVTVICTDKTGTLTCNRMTVEQVAGFGPYTPEELSLALAANSTALLDSRGEPLGNPTEGALLRWITTELDADYEALRRSVEIRDRLPFSTERKYMATLIYDPVRDEQRLFVKGAPEIVRSLCSADGDDTRLQEQLLSWQQHAMRTLGVAWCTTRATSCEEALQREELCFMAAFAIGDPVRDEVPEAVARCLRAGIGIKIVTGDTPATATEIARRIGLWDDQRDGERQRITGPEFSALTDEELLERIGELKIIARARPLDKQRLVQLLQRQGEVVAVTGDGTNDAPALNFANVGLSMGSGTSVAKDAGDITLLDDSFRSIVTAVLWGRSLYRNIQRFLLFQLTINLTAILILFLGSLFGSEMPLTVVQMLWVNLIMDTFAAMALASLPPEEEVMRERPRPRNQFIITRPMASSILGWGLCFVVGLLSLLFWMDRGDGLSLRELTIFFSIFVFLQFWNLFNAKGFGTHHPAIFDHRDCRMFFLVLLLIGLGQIAIVEWGGTIFRTCPLTPETWCRIIGLSSIVALAGELIRQVKRSMKRK